MSGRYRPALLLAVSYAFYCTWSVPGAVVLAAITGLTYLAPIASEKVRSGTRRGHTAVLTVALLVCYLFAFKIALITPGHGIGGLIMPLGISYYTFRLISYVLDVHWGKIAAERRFLHFAAYVSFFPQIVAGPIQRAGEFFGQMPPKPIQVGNGIARVGWGLAKKLIVADNLGTAVNGLAGHGVLELCERFRPDVRWAEMREAAPRWVKWSFASTAMVAGFAGVCLRLVGSEGRPARFLYEIL